MAGWCSVGNVVSEVTFDMVCFIVFCNFCSVLDN